MGVLSRGEPALDELPLDRSGWSSVCEDEDGLHSGLRKGVPETRGGPAGDLCEYTSSPRSSSCSLASFSLLALTLSQVEDLVRGLPQSLVLLDVVDEVVDPDPPSGPLSPCVEAHVLGNFLLPPFDADLISSKISAPHSKSLPKYHELCSPLRVATAAVLLHAAFTQKRRASC